MTQLYSISFYICWRLERKQNPIFYELSEITKKLIRKHLDPKLDRPIFSKKMTPEIGNECIKDFRKKLEDFKFDDGKIRVSLRDADGCENFAIEDRKYSVVGQYRLTFKVYDRGETGENYDRALPKLLCAIREISVETNKGVTLKITGYRTHGQIKENESLWPKNASTEF